MGQQSRISAWPDGNVLREFIVAFCLVFCELMESKNITIRMWQSVPFLRRPPHISTGWELLGKVIPVVYAKLISRKRTVYNTTKCI